MGTFLIRSRFTITKEEPQGQFELNFTTPVLTIAGELDGLARVIRMTEAYYK